MTTFLTGPFYVVVCGSEFQAYTPERKVSACNYAGTIADIASMQFEDLHSVIEIGSGRDMTEQMVRAAMHEWACSGEPITDAQHHLIEMHIGIQAAHSFRRAA